MNQDLYKKIDFEVTDLHFNWNIFCNVYAVSDDQVKILNKVDSTFFGTIQSIYWQAIILQLSRLTDEEFMGKGKQKRNISLYTLFNDIKSDMNSEELDLLHRIKEQIENYAKNLRIYRSKKIAHSDYIYVMKKESISFEGLRKRDIEKLLKAIRDFMNFINKKYFDSTTLYDEIMGLNAGKDLVDYLSDRV